MGWGGVGGGGGKWLNGGNTVLREELTVSPAGVSCSIGPPYQSGMANDSAGFFMSVTDSCS